ncbi:MAG: hypothetical protein ACJKSS_02765 [Patescibacteria group bacterium UBA2103]
MKKEIMTKKIVHAIPGALFVFLLAGGIVYAANFTQPSESFPNGNVEAPINVGSSAQSKSGDLVAGALAGVNVLASNSFCLGGSNNCITDWPAVSVPGFNEVCTFERVGVFPAATTDGPNKEGYQDYCTTRLSASAKAQGWVVLGSDSCSEDRNDCTTDGTACYLGRFVCDGNFIPSTNATYTISQAQSAGLYAGPAAPQCSDGIDNDGDGLIDLQDFNCDNAQDNSEDGGQPN